jgi:phosphopantothenoylcysteine decarboxylase / phosphopantothenate---cysteine ligase
MLSGKNVLLGVTGSIAAYKSTLIVRQLIKSGAAVQVIVTPASLDFVTPLTLATLSKNPVFHEFTSDKESGQWNNHVALGLWADLFLIAPVSANTLAKMTTGVCDNLLMAVYLSAKCPVYFAPAMDLDMHAHETTQKNIELLSKRGNIEIPAESGELASGLEGTGRMAEPENIVEFINSHLLKNAPLYGKKVMITAGPTYEKIDPVRFIGNYSTGKMGYALADAMAEKGAEVTIVSGPVQVKPSQTSIKVLHVESAQQMFEACKLLFGNMNVSILAAAVSDYKPRNMATSKIKKKEDFLTLELEKNQDILAYLGTQKKDHQMLAGFALETDHEIENALEKLKRKNLDFIFLNSLKDKGAGFTFDTNKVTMIDKSNKITTFELMSKTELAKKITLEIINKLP